MNKYTKESSKRVSMHAYKQPCSTTTKDTKKSCTKATNESSKRREAHNKNISLCATMFNITRTPRKKRIHKNTKGKLKERLACNHVQ
jgi:hypothetical protein